MPFDTAHPPAAIRHLPAQLLAALLLCTFALAATAGPAAPREFTIDAGEASRTLNEFGRQSGLQMLFDFSALQGVSTQAVKGRMEAPAALARMLSGTGLSYKFTDAQTVSIMVREGADQEVGQGSAAHQTGEAIGALLRLVRNDDDARAAAAVAREDEVVNEPPSRGVVRADSGIPEILVKGARSGNTDIRRTEDDVQPYVVFNAEEIRRSMAPDLETFLRTRLPMNQSRGSEGQSLTSSRGNQSSVDLRGLGADQTLILVNGRRMPGVANGVDFSQPDINGISLSAVERIEILPSTAGGIYGGGATGGVVNIVLKRDYNDLELTARYDGTFAGGGAERRLDATAGFTLEGGRTNVMLTASYRDGNPLYMGDRNFAARAWALQDKNNHAAFVAGSNPVHGYTTNIRSVNGSDLVLKEGMVSLNSPIAHVPMGYAGPASDNGAALLGTAGQYNLALANDVVGAQYSLLNAPSVRSLQLSVWRELTDRIEAFVDAARYDNRSVRMGSAYVRTRANVTLSEGANNPFTEAVKLSVPLVGYAADGLRTPVESLSEKLSGGIVVRLPREWTVQGEYSLGRSNSIYQVPRDLFTADGSTALTDGRLDPLSDVNAYPLDFSTYYPGNAGGGESSEYPAAQEIATLRVSGPLLQLPGGPLRLAALLERREQFTGDRVSARFPSGGGTPSYTYIAEVGSSTDSGYTELNAPLISATNARPGLLGLDLRASYRYDTTTTRTRPFDQASVNVPSPDGPFPDVPFQTNNVIGNQYTLGFRYTPVESVALRVSYGEGILPPSSSQLSEIELPPFIPLSTVFRGIFDPKRGGLPVDTATVEQFLQRGSVLLRPERSASWSAGLIFTLANLPGFRLSVDYTLIEKIDEIGSLGTQVLLDLEDEFPDVIVRDELTAADAALGYTGGTIREFNGGSVNIAKSLMEAVDIQADYNWETRFGSFTANVLATVQPGLKQQPTPDSDEFNTVGYSDGPLKWRANAGIRWSHSALDLGWNLQYYDASLVYTSTASDTSRDRVVLNQGSAWIPTQTYHDVYGRYRFENALGFVGGLLRNSELQVSVLNVFNTSPPVLATSAYYAVGGYATEGDPRLRRYSIAFTKRFGR